MRRATRNRLATLAFLATLTCLTTQQTRAQFIYRPYGYGYYGPYGYGYGYDGYGVGYGYGGYGGYGYAGNVFGAPIGMTLADQLTLKHQTYALNAARYNYTNAQAAMAYQAALLYRQQALNTYLQNQRAVAGLVPQLRPEAAGSPGAAEADPDNRPIPLSQLVATDGRVLWPLMAPTEGELGPARQAADQAIRAVIVPFAGGNRVPVRDIVAARNALSAYVAPATERLRQENPEAENEFMRFARSLDEGLRTIDRVSAVAAEQEAGAQEGQAPPIPQDLRPEGAPRTGGDAVKEAIINDNNDRPDPQPTPPAGQAEPPAPAPGAPNPVSPPAPDQAVAEP